VGQKSFDALELDAGLSLPVVPERKSPRVGIKRERHEKEFNGFEGKGKGLLGDKGGVWRKGKAHSPFGPGEECGTQTARFAQGKREWLCNLRRNRSAQAKAYATS
jgi:hypothetical protein